MIQLFWQCLDSFSLPIMLIVLQELFDALSYSYDGTNWTNSSNGSTFLSQPATAVSSSPTMFVAGGPSGSQKSFVGTSGPLRGPDRPQNKQTSRFRKSFFKLY